MFCSDVSTHACDEVIAQAPDEVSSGGFGLSDARAIRITIPMVEVMIRMFGLMTGKKWEKVFKNISFSLAAQGR